VSDGAARCATCAAIQERGPPDGAAGKPSGRVFFGWVRWIASRPRVRVHEIVVDRRTGTRRRVLVSSIRAPAWPTRGDDSRSARTSNRSRSPPAPYLRARNQKRNANVVQPRRDCERERERETDRRSAPRLDVERSPVSSRLVTSRRRGGAYLRYATPPLLTDDLRAGEITR